MDWLSEIPVIGEALELFSLIPSSDTYSDLKDRMFWTEVEGSGLDTRSHLLAEKSIVPVQWDETGTKVISGQWQDINGFQSSDPGDFDIDHRVSFRQIAEELPDFYALPETEQLKIFNDLQNLQILHDKENILKSNSPPMEYASSIKNPAFKEEFISNAREYLSVLAQRYKG